MQSDGLAAFFVALWLLVPCFWFATFVSAGKRKLLDRGWNLHRLRWGLSAAWVVLFFVIGAAVPPETNKPATPPVVAVAPAAVAPAPVEAAPSSIATPDYAARLAQEKAIQAAETKAPVTATELKHGIDALCQVTMQQMDEVMRGEKKAEDTGSFITLGAALKILMDRYGASDYRAVAIVGAATKQMQADDPNGANGNMVEYCTHRAAGS